MKIREGIKGRGVLEKEINLACNPLAHAHPVPVTVEREVLSKKRGWRPSPWELGQSVMPIDERSTGSLGPKSAHREGKRGPATDHAGKGQGS